MTSTRLRIATPSDFRFEAVVSSHGWERLAPFSIDREANRLTRLEALPGGPARLVISPDGDALRVDVDTTGDLGADDEAAARALVRRCCSLDWDLGACHAAVADDPTLGFIAERKLGRLLVAPTMWEDLVKTLFLTNTQAAHTTAMAARLCSLGEPVGDALGGGHTFPTAERVAAMREDELADAAGAGYRTPYLLALAQAVADGAFDPEALRDPDLDDDHVAARVTALSGFGPYAAAYVLKLLGRFRRIGIDVAIRRFAREIMQQPEATDAEITARYARFGDCAGLVAWWEVHRYAEENGILPM